MNERVIIIGAGGHSKVVADIVRASKDIVVGFLDDSYDGEKEFYGSKIIGRVDSYSVYKNDCVFVIAIGNNSVRDKISSMLDCKWYTGIHPSAVISNSARIGEGTVIMPNAVVNADAKVGKHVIVNTGSIVEHDCTIGDFSHIAPKSVVCGASHIGSYAWLGTGSTVSNLAHICDNVLLGAGGVVVKDICESGTYVGVPARKIK